MIDLFKDLGLPEDKLHPKFLQLKKLMMDGERKIVSSWAEGFVDRDNKIVTEFQTTFHSAFWELFLHRVFSDLDFTIDFSRNRPDFIISSPAKFYVEAVIAGIRNNGRLESARNQDDILDNFIPPHLQGDFDAHLIEAIVRYSNAIYFKLEKLETKYRQLPWLDNNVPFVIALSSYSQVNYGREYYHPMLALLYGMFYDAVEDEYSELEQVLKPGSKAPINLSIFNDPRMREVSAIIFSCTVTIGKLTALSKSANNFEFNQNTVLIVRQVEEEPHFRIQDVSEESPELHSDGLFVFHNPNARVQLPIETFENCCALQFVIRDEGTVASFGHREPMVARINLPTITLQSPAKETFMQETFMKFNRIDFPTDLNE